MTTGDTPTISNTYLSNTAYGLGNLGQGLATQGTAATNYFAAQAANYRPRQAQFDLDEHKRDFLVEALRADAKTKEAKVADKITRRLVQVFICDPEDNIPLDDCLLHRGNQHLTEATDQELFFEIDIKGILEKHNAKRVKIVNKKIKERTEYLEPVKVRDLKMVVVTVAQF